MVWMIGEWGQTQFDTVELLCSRAPEPQGTELSVSLCLLLALSFSVHLSLCVVRACVCMSLSL